MDIQAKIKEMLKRRYDAGYEAGIRDTLAAMESAVMQEEAPPARSKPTIVPDQKQPSIKDNGRSGVWPLSKIAVARQATLDLLEDQDEVTKDQIFQIASKKHDHITMKDVENALAELARRGVITRDIGKAILKQRGNAA